MDEPKPWPEIERRSARRDVPGPLVGTGEESFRRRRLRDRIEGEDGVALNPALGRKPQLRNPLLLCDDDLRQTALALDGIEGFLLQAVRLLEKRDLRPEDVAALLSEDVDSYLDALGGTLESLRRSLGTIATQL